MHTYIYLWSDAICCQQNIAYVYTHTYMYSTAHWLTFTFNIYAHVMYVQLFAAKGIVVLDMCLSLCKLYTSLFFLIVVPTPVTDLNATAFGITCINVTWSGPDELRGNEEIYFVTFSDGSSNMTLNASSANFLPLMDITPGLNYSIGVCTHIHTCTCICWKLLSNCIYYLQRCTNAYMPWKLTRS